MPPPPHLSSGDVVVIVTLTGRRETVRSRSRAKAPGSDDPVVRYAFWHDLALAQRAPLAAALARLAAGGRHVYWRTTSPMCGCGGFWRPCPYWPTASNFERDVAALGQLNAALRESNDALAAGVCNASARATPDHAIRVLDSYRWVMDADALELHEEQAATPAFAKKAEHEKRPAAFPACEHYDDAIHNSRLQFGHVNSWLCDVCSLQGASTPRSTPN